MQERAVRPAAAGAVEAACCGEWLPVVPSLKNENVRERRSGAILRLSRLLKRKDDSAYGHRAPTLEDARAAVAQAETFATWVEAELVRG